MHEPALRELTTMIPRRRRIGVRAPPQLLDVIPPGVTMSRRAGERRSKRPAPAWTGPQPWSQLRPGDEFALAVSGALAQRFRVVAVILTDAAMAPPSADSSEIVLTLTVGILPEPLVGQPAQRLIVTAIAVQRRRR